MHASHIIDYLKLDAVELSEHIARGDMTAEHAMRCALELAGRYDEPYGVLCHAHPEAALESARQGRPGTRFAGVPFLLKDSGLPSTRLPSSVGSRLFSDTRYAQDSTLASRLEQAGLIPFARTRVSELCMAPTSEAVRYGGPTRNPWAPERSAGGSSGGSAVAVALGIVPMAHGSDGGGSVRIPAACCGVFGFKPSRGLLPVGPLKGESLGGMATDGVLSQTVRDSAALLDAVSGYEPGSPYASPVCAKPLSASVVPAIGRARLRVGVWREAWNGVPIAQPCLQAVQQAADLCRELGHEVVDLPLPNFNYDQFVDAHATMLATTIARLVDARLRQTGQSLADGDLEPAIADGYTLGKRIDAITYAGAVDCFHGVGRAIERAMASCDLILSPALTTLPVKLGTLTSVGGFLDFRRRVSEYTTFLAIINASGQPAASVPLHWTADGLPVAVQLIGHFGQDDLVMRLAAEFERAAPWHGRLARFRGDAYAQALERAA